MKQKVKALESPTSSNPEDQSEGAEANTWNLKERPSPKGLHEGTGI